MRAPPESDRPMIGAPVLHGEVHDLADLLGVGLGQRAAEDREVLRVDEDQPPVDPSVAGDHAVAQIALLVDAEVGGPMRHERIQLHEAAFVEQQLDALARRQLAAFVLLLDALLAAAELRLFAQLCQCASLSAVDKGVLRERWWAQQGSNLRPAGYEPDALTTELWARWMVDNFEYRGSSLHKDIDIASLWITRMDAGGRRAYHRTGRRRDRSTSPGPQLGDLR